MKKNYPCSNWCDILVMVNCSIIIERAIVLLNVFSIGILNIIRHLYSRFSFLANTFCKLFFALVNQHYKPDTLTTSRQQTSCLFYSIQQYCQKKILSNIRLPHRPRFIYKTIGYPHYNLKALP